MPFQKFLNSPRVLVPAPWASPWRQVAPTPLFHGLGDDTSIFLLKVLELLMDFQFSTNHAPLWPIPMEDPPQPPYPIGPLPMLTGHHGSNKQKIGSDYTADPFPRKFSLCIITCPVTLMTQVSGQMSPSQEAPPSNLP